jgi:hypothetical protein|nr:MAG TPA: ATP synthase [Crassvirales sp.]
MTLLFQAVDSVKVVDKAFQIDPTNVFQFLVGGLILIIIALSTVIVILFKRITDREKRLEELTVNITSVAVNATQVLDSLVHSVDKLPTAIDSHKGEIRQAIKESENAILRTLDRIKK